MLRNVAKCRAVLQQERQRTSLAHAERELCASELSMAQKQAHA
jgi:hypothetical protein